MKEDFLHYLWKFRKFDTKDCECVHGEKLQIHHQGIHNLLAGPDFFNSHISLDGQLWAGNVEVHLKSSDWYAHRHEEDPAYENVILHVVWEHDAEIYRKDGNPIPTFVLSKYLKEETRLRYAQLFSSKLKWINCENDFAKVDEFIIQMWMNRLYFERLEQKSELISHELDTLQNHWEALLFRMLCKNFGLKINGPAFLSLAHSIDFTIVQKLDDAAELEALFFGQALLLEGEKEDAYFSKLQENYAYLKHKFKLQNFAVVRPQFFKLRPPNFPTIRLSQLASLYAVKKNLFSEIIAAETIDLYYEIFDVAASDYWSTHFNFEVPGKKRKKRLSKDFIHLLLINTIIPMKFAFADRAGKDISESLLALASSIPKEENSIIKKFNSIKASAENAVQSQALLQLKKEYCDKNRCLQCAVGHFLISGPKPIMTKN